MSGYRSLRHYRSIPPHRSRMNRDPYKYSSRATPCSRPLRTWCCSMTAHPLRSHRRREMSTRWSCCMSMISHTSRLSVVPRPIPEDRHTELVPTTIIEGTESFPVFAHDCPPEPVPPPPICAQLVPFHFQTCALPAVPPPVRPTTKVPLYPVMDVTERIVGVAMDGCPYAQEPFMPLPPDHRPIRPVDTPRPERYRSTSRHRYCIRFRHRVSHR
jgi:hypothetical protein